MIGWDWPFSPFWYVLLSVIICVILFIHGRMLLKGTLPQLAKRLISLRVLAVLFFLILMARPFVMTDQPNPRDFKILSLTDFSGSMNTRDSGENMKRIEQVRPFFSLDNDDYESTALTTELQARKEGPVTFHQTPPSFVYIAYRLTYMRTSGGTRTHNLQIRSLSRFHCATRTYTSSGI